MLRAALTALFVALPAGAATPAALALVTEQQVTRAENFRRGFNSGVLEPERFTQIDQPAYTDAMLELARTACLQEDARIPAQGCATLGALTGRRAELTYRARIAQTGETYVPYSTGPFASEAERAQAIRAYHLRANPDAETTEEARDRAASFLEQTQPCIDALEGEARGHNDRSSDAC